MNGLFQTREKGSIIKWLHGLLIAYMVAAGFTAWPDIQVTPESLRLPELIFIPLFVVWLIISLQQKNYSWRLTPFDWTLLVYFFMMIAPLFILKDALSLKDYSITLYLLLVFLVFKKSLAIIPSPHLFVQNTFIITGCILTLLAFIGWAGYHLGWTNPFVSTADCYFPFADQWIQAAGPMTTPNMLHQLIGICLLFFVSDLLSREKRTLLHYLILGILVIGLVLTFSKSILLWLISLIFFFVQYKQNDALKKWAYTTCLVLFFICMLGSHFLFLNKTNISENLTRDQSCYSRAILFETDNQTVHLTNYAINKISAVRAGMEHPLLGIGVGNFNIYVDELKNEGSYPEYFASFDPHSTYTGIFAEMGIPGVLILIYLVVQIIIALKKIAPGSDKKAMAIHFALQASFLFIALDAIILDVLHFRHLWILLGLLFVSPHRS